ncbi:MAG: hypothetical protein PUB18_02670 [bacterium]|nr:hypothetical protein [bacterium]
MKKLFVTILSGIGILAAGAASTACVAILVDEPDMPAAMIEA